MLSYHCHLIEARAERVEESKSLVLLIQQVHRHSSGDSRIRRPNDDEVRRSKHVVMYGVY
jgi:hypothetical protein